MNKFNKYGGPWIVLLCLLVMLVLSFNGPAPLPYVLVGIWALVSGIFPTVIMFAGCIIDGSEGRLTSRNEIMKGLQECVVQNACPQGESKTHMFMDKMQYLIAKPFRNYPSLVVFSLALRIWVGMFLVVPFCYDFNDTTN